MSSIVEKLEDYLKISMFEPKPEVYYVTDEELFNRMADFIIELDPEILNNYQLQIVMNIINDLEILSDDGEEIIEAAKIANKTLASKKTYGRQYYRKNKNKVMTQKERIAKSAKGRKREKAKDRLAKGNKTPTGRPIRKYHTKGHTNQ